MKERYWFLKTFNEAQVMNQKESQNSKILQEVLKNTMNDMKIILKDIEKGFHKDSEIRKEK